MTLRQQVTHQLDRYASFQAGSETLSVDHDGQRLRCELVDLDALGCAFTSFSLSSDKLAGATVDALCKIGEQLSTKINYLLEPIRTVEVDEDQATVQLRSDPPHRDADRITYYELLVQTSGGLVLKRYRGQSGQPREQIPAQVTREVFGRLVDDFSAAL